MREDKLFEGSKAEVSTQAFHAMRERADHWSEGHQRPRMEMALQFIDIAVGKLLTTSDELPTLSDLGCGDGGMLAQIKERHPHLNAWGFDFQPSNVKAAQEVRHLRVSLRDVFNFAPLEGNPVYPTDVSDVLGRIVVMTEVLEHLSTPHKVLWNLASRDHTRYVVASSPHGEHKDSHDGCHAWAWDEEGYARMFQENGWSIIRHERVDWSQVVLATQQGWSG